MANTYTTGVTAFLNKEMDWDADTYKCILVTSSYTFDADHDTYADITNECTNSGYTTTGVAMTTSAAANDDANDWTECDATDVTFSSMAAGDQPYAAIVYNTTVSNNLVCYCTLTTPPAPNGGDYVIQWHADGVFKVIAHA
jgi:hypothetical protein